MKKKLLLFLLFVISLGFSQSQKSKSISVTIPSYPSEVSVENLKTYDIRFIDKAQRALPFNEKELRKELQFEDKQLVEDGADMFFAVKGLGVDDIYTSIKRNASIEQYIVDVLPLNHAKISVMLMVKGEPTQLVDFPIIAKTNNGAKLPTVVKFSFKEAEEYLDFADVDNAKPSPTLVKAYLKEHLNNDFLKDFALKIAKNYDYSAHDSYSTLYYIKDKKNKPLKEESKKKLFDFQDFLKGKKTLKELRNSKAELEDYKKYWLNLLETYKSEKKVAWAMLVNLNLLSMITENIEEGADYLNKLVALKTKSWATSAVKSRFNEFKELYNKNHNNEGKRIYQEAYAVDPVLQAIVTKEEAKKRAKADDVNKKDGYLILSKGDKLEGKVTLLFSEPEDDSKGNIVSIDGPIAGKYVTITFTNEKGKTKTKTFKFKKVKEVVVGERTFKPVRAEADALNSAFNALSLTFNNTFFMEEMYSSEKIGLYKDNRLQNSFYYLFPNDKKAKMLNPGLNDNFNKKMTEIFGKCPVVIEKLNAGEIQQNKEDLLKVAKLYTEKCN